MLTNKQNKTSYVWLGMASVIFALAIVPTDVRAQKQSKRSRAASATTQDPRTVVNLCTGDRALDPACQKERLDSIEQKVNSMAAQLQEIQDTLNQLNSSMGEVQKMIGAEDKGDETTKNLWTAISSIKARLANARIP